VCVAGLGLRLGLGLMVVVVCIVGTLGSSSILSLDPGGARIRLELSFGGRVGGSLELFWLRWGLGLGLRLGGVLDVGCWGDLARVVYLGLGLGSGSGLGLVLVLVLAEEEEMFSLVVEGGFGCVAPA